MMAQQHKIMRQVIEVRGCSSEASQHIQSELRGAYYERLLPLIEKICSQQSAPDRINRIDSLQIDLGEVSLDAFEASLVDKFEAMFSHELAKAIDDVPEVDADLELFDFFIRTGTVPWWVNGLEPNQFNAKLEGLIQRAPHELRRILQSTVEQEPMLQRLVRAYPDELLDALLKTLSPALSATGSDVVIELQALFEGINAARGVCSRITRNLFWEEVLRAAISDDSPAVLIIPQFFSAILNRVARRLDRNYYLLITELHNAMEDKAISKSSRMREIIEYSWQTFANESINMPEPNESNGGKAKPNMSSEYESDRLDRKSMRVRAEQSSELVSRSREPSSRTDENVSLVDLTFSDADALYIDNAGLVILWPFLVNFFTRLGLVEDKKFKNEAAAQRAVGLLQYLANEDASPLEILLPINKVLCGLAPEAVFDFGADITPQEKEECHDLLVAVIQQAPILNDMSLAGFRSSFLLRQGQLGTRDGNWLLRVERETYDIVLDRFPWGVQIVKLPWMQAMMQVEW